MDQEGPDDGTDDGTVILENPHKRLQAFELVGSYKKEW